MFTIVLGFAATSALAEFGSVVAAAGNNVLVGDAGAVYLFDATDGDLLQIFRDPSNNRSFGSSVALFGTNVLVSAPGAGYLFDASNGNLLQTFLNPVSRHNNSFGSSIAAIGNNVLIGAMRDHTSALGAGAAYLFDATTGNLLKTFIDPTPVANSHFGSYVGAIGNDILVGSNADTEAAHIFDAATGDLLQTFLVPTTPDSLTVAAAGNNVLIGAPFDNTGDQNFGAAYLFNAATGNLVDSFVSPMPMSYDLFGSSIASVGDSFLIGAWRSGAAYLFDTVTGEHLRTFLDPTSDMQPFAWSVAGIGSNVLIGEPFFAGNDGVRTGAVHLCDASTGDLLKTFVLPEPSPLALLAMGATGIAALRRRRKDNAETAPAQT